MTWLLGGDGLAHCVKQEQGLDVLTGCGILLTAKDSDGEVAPIPVATEGDILCWLCCLVSAVDIGGDVMTQDEQTGGVVLTDEQQLELSVALGQQYGARVMLDFVVLALHKLADECEWNGQDDVTYHLAAKLNLIADQFERERENSIRIILAEKGPTT